MKARMLKKDAEWNFKNDCLPFLDETDRPSVRQAWNDYVDSLERDGWITEKQAATWTHPSFISR